MLLALAGLTLFAVVGVEDEPHDRIAVNLLRQLGGEVQDRRAPEFTVTDLNGRAVSLSTFRGEVLLVNFWASWCPPCVEEFPSMIALSEALDGRPFRMLTLTQDEDSAELLAFAGRLGIPTERVLVLQDPEGRVAQHYGTELLPETYLVDANGWLVARFQGDRDWSSREAQQLIERLIRHAWRKGEPAPPSRAISLEG